MRPEMYPLVGRLPAPLVVIAAALAVLFTSVAAVSAQSPAGRVALVTCLPEALAHAVDAGPVPASQRLSLTLTLAPTATQAAALDQFLADLTTASSPHYHKWLTPQEFGANYGPSADQIAAATAWAQSQGLSVDAVSPSGMRLSVSGFAWQIESAFAVSMHQYQIAGGLYFANAMQPSLMADVAPMFSSIEGLDDLPTSAVVSGEPATLVNGKPLDMGIAGLASMIDANVTPVMTIDATAGVGTPSPSRIAAYAALFRQAAAQGVTTLLARGDSGGFPSTLPEVTVIALPGGTADLSTPVAARPVWQDAPGLPTDNSRHAPDLTASSLAAFAQAVGSISVSAGGRLGNMNPTLYALAPLPGIYAQPDQAAAGTWEAATGLGLVDTTALAKAFPKVTGSGTTILQITTTAYTPAHGTPFYLMVQDESANAGVVPTGTITFTAPQAGFTASTVALNTIGTLQSPNYVLPGGTYVITATYSGDSNYQPTSGSITITVPPEAAVFTLTAPSSVSLGSTISATVTLASASGVGTPSASVTVTPSGITGAQAVTQTVSGSNGTASATYTFATKNAGSVSLQASCTSSDPSFTCYTPQTSTTTVPQATPTVLLSISPTAPVAGQAITFAAAVTGVAGIGTTGTVQFFDGSTLLGSGSAPTATYNGTVPAGASHSFTAVYQGDTNYLKATSNTVATSVGTAPTTTTVSASATTATFGQAITLNIVVSSTSVVNGTQPTGTLTFTGAGTTTTATLSGGSANVTLSSLAVGTYTVTTAYSGDTNYSVSTGNTVTLTVTQATASLNTQISSASFTTGSTSTLTTTVTLPGNAQLPTGTTFIATIVGVTGASYTGTFAINPGGNTGTGAVTIPAPIAGSYTLQVTCGTNTNFTCTPNNLSITSTSTTAGTNPATGITATVTTLTISPKAPAVGQTITLTATVSAAASAIAANPIAGTVNFYDGTTLLGSGTITTVAGVATATATAALPASTGTMVTAQSLTAVYQGNTVYASSTSVVVSVTPAAAAATIALSANVTSTISGTSVVLTATVSGLTASGVSPTGTVSFYLAGAKPTLIGAATLGTTGSGISTAVFATANLPNGVLTIYATYGGDSNFGTATSGDITVGISDYVVSFVPQTLTIAQGMTGSTTAVATAVNGFSGNIIFGCTPPPNTYVTCSFNPEVISGSGTSKLTVATTAGTDGVGLIVRGGGAALGTLLLCWLVPSRRRRMARLLLGLMALGLAMNLGCSGNDFNAAAANAAGGTPLGTMLLQINSAGTNGSGTIRHNFTFQVTVVGQ